MTQSVPETLARCKAARSRANEGGGIFEEKWLAALDDFRNWLIREAA